MALSLTQIPLAMFSALRNRCIPILISINQLPPIAITGRQLSKLKGDETHCHDSHGRHRLGGGNFEVSNSTKPVVEGTQFQCIRDYGKYTLP